MSPKGGCHTWWLHLSREPVASTNMTSADWGTKTCVLFISWSHTATTTEPSFSCLIDAIFSPARALNFSISSLDFTKLSGPFAEPNFLEYFVKRWKTVPEGGLMDLFEDILKNSSSPSFSFSSAMYTSLAFDGVYESWNNWKYLSTVSFETPRKLQAFVVWIFVIVDVFDFHFQCKTLNTFFFLAIIQFICEESRTIGGFSR